MEFRTFSYIIVIIGVAVPYYQNFIGDPMEDSVTFTVMCFFSALFWYVVGSVIDNASPSSSKQLKKFHDNRLKKKKKKQ